MSRRAVLLQLSSACGCEELTRLALHRIATSRPLSMRILELALTMAKKRLVRSPCGGSVDAMFGIDKALHLNRHQTHTCNCHLWRIPRKRWTQSVSADKGVGLFSNTHRVFTS